MNRPQHQKQRFKLTRLHSTAVGHMVLNNTYDVDGSWGPYVEPASRTQQIDGLVQDCSNSSALAMELL